MTKTKRRPGTAFLLALPLLLTVVNAVSLTGCSSQNTGEGGQSSSSIYMSNGQCSNNCQGYAFAITQWQNCWCSNEAPGDTASVGDCSQKCPGYPSELCGNQDQGLYGYVALGPAPQGTLGAGGGSGSSSSGGGSSSIVSSAPATSAVVSPSTETVVQTQVSTYVPPVSSVDPATIVQTQQNTETQVVSVAPTTIVQDPSTAVIAGPTSTISSVATITPTPVVITSAQAVTVSGSVITHFITSTPSPVPPSSQSNELPKQTKSGISSGAAAGAAIGAIAGAVLLGALIFFFLRRRRQQNNSTLMSGDDAEPGAPVKRNTSVLSRVGLLRNSNNAETTRGPTLPRIMTTGIAGETGPGSAATMESSQMSENLSRRHSRPLFSDSRLNPNALMTQTNISRTSVSTLQDNQDYSRPLEVRNPDVPRSRG